jgi:hypothetical protein
MAIIKPNNNTISAITALPAGISTGKVLQVVFATTTNTGLLTTSTSYVDSGLSASITPSSTSNKILITFCHNVILDATITDDFRGDVRIVRGSTEIAEFEDAKLNRATGGSASYVRSAVQSSFQHLDTPSTTSATTYKTQFRAGGGSGARFGIESAGNCRSNVILMEIAG